jgi:3-deoxy-7-phosphoheptulonate synthase
VLRGGRARTNYDAASIADAEATLLKHKLPTVMMVDCSHANSEKKHAKQEDVWRSVIDQRVNGTKSVIGMMVESHLHEGNQPFPKPVNESAIRREHHRRVRELGDDRTHVALGL